MPARRPATLRAATPIAFVQAIVRAYARYGADPSRALAQARIAPSLLDDPDARITAAQMEAVSGYAMQELDDEALGWFSRRLPWGSYGLLCRASLTSPDLGVALKRWCRHHALLTDDLRYRLTADGETAALDLVEQRDFGDLREFCLVTCLRYLHGYACWLVDRRLPLRSVSFPFPAPPHAPLYRPLFPGPVSFGAERAGFVFEASLLALPVRRDETALRDMLLRALPLTVLPYRHERRLAPRVRAVLQRALTAGDEPPTAATVAAALNLSVRTLHRQLQVEGSALQTLKDAVRRERALELLRRSDRPVKQVAEAAGFRNEKSFSRAFRDWTGQSPAAWRASGGATER